MNDKPELKPELQLVDLGDTKEVTMGIPSVDKTEDNPTLFRKPMAG